MNFTGVLLFLHLFSSTTHEVSFAQNQEIMQVQEFKRTVVFIRHAKSSWDYPELPDFDRPLNDRGNRDAPFMGKKLKEMGIEFDLILSSPSKRTTQTIAYICKEIDYSLDSVVWDSSLYHSTTGNIVHLLEKLDDSIKAVAVVSHNPSMTMISEQLQKQQLIDNVPTTGIVSISFDVKHWKDFASRPGTLDFFIYPKKYKAKK